MGWNPLKIFKSPEPISEADKAIRITPEDRRKFFDHGLITGYRLHQQHSRRKPVSYEDKIDLILESPAAFYVYDMLADLFSLGRFKMYESRAEDAPEIEDHPLLNLLAKPNPRQTQAQFMYDYMFFRKLGTANLVVDSEVLTERSMMYFLKNQYIEWPQWFEDNKDTLFFSEEMNNAIQDVSLIYKTKSQRLVIPMSRIQQWHDVSNGLTSWWQSPSRVDAIYKIIVNSDLALGSKATVSDFSGKFIVGSEAEFENTHAEILGDREMDSVRQIAHSNHSILAMAARTQVNPMINSDRRLQSIEDSWKADAYNIGRLLKIPKDVLEILGSGATYENQEKARAAMMYYSCQPEGNDLAQGIMQKFNRTMGYLDSGLDLRYEVDHLPFVQTFMKDQSDVKAKLASAFRNLRQSGASAEDSAAFLGIDIENFEKPFFGGQTTDQQNSEEDPEDQGSLGE